MDDIRALAIGDLARAAGVSRRTVRYYVQRGLLAPPEGLGRGSHYTPEHLRALLEVKGLQEQGASLDEVRLLRSGPPAALASREAAHAPAPVVPGRAYLRQEILPGYELHVRAGKPPLTGAQLEALARHLESLMEEEVHDGPER